MYIISKSINNMTTHVYICISFPRIWAVLLGTFRSMDNTCIINLTYSLKSQFDINPIWYPYMDTVLCNPVHPYTCLHYLLLYYLYMVPQEDSHYMAIWVPAPTQSCFLANLNCHLYYYTSCTHNWLRNKHLSIYQYSLTPCSSETR